MGTKTISLADDAYERLKAEKRDGESFSDVVRRLTSGVALTEFHGVLSEETADDLTAAIDDRRSRHAGQRERRRERLTDVFNDS